MTVDCEDLVQARAVVSPLECKRLIERLDRDFVLTDVVFELDDHPNGAQSKACGYVWNAMPNRWSRKLLGGHVDDSGRRYHLITGLLCPRGSWLSVCTCWFVNQPTSRLWALLSGYYCNRSPWDVVDVDVNEIPTIDWTDTPMPDALDPMDPSGRAALTQDMGTSIMTRTLLGTTREAVERGELWIDGRQTRIMAAPGSTVAVQVAGEELSWTSGDRSGSAIIPERTSLVVVRRSADGRSIHIISYEEEDGSMHDTAA